VALRHLVQTDGKEVLARFEPQPRRAAWRARVAVAAVLVALVGGYLVGERRREPAASAAPPPTRVVQAPAAWQDPRGMR
jgi:hypothetical protein